MGHSPGSRAPALSPPSFAGSQCDAQLFGTLLWLLLRDCEGRSRLPNKSTCKAVSCIILSILPAQSLRKNPHRNFKGRREWSTALSFVPSAPPSKTVIDLKRQDPP